MTECARPACRDEARQGDKMCDHHANLRDLNLCGVLVEAYNSQTIVVKMQRSRAKELSNQLAGQPRVAWVDILGTYLDEMTRRMGG